MNRNVPQDLWPEILCRLPVKTLLRFRCVSKSWQAMIEDPNFCHLHLHRFQNNTCQTHLLFLQLEASFSRLDLVVRRSDTMEATATIGNVASFVFLGPKSNFDNFGYPGRWAMLCMLDGLVLLSQVHTPSLLLWNPAIRKFHGLPPLPEPFYRMESGSFGLGFDPLTKDFKHVRLIRLGENVLHSVCVYSVQAGLWKVIRFRGCWHWSFSRYLGPLGFRTVCFQGYMCFIARNLDLDTNELVSFDLSKEVFASISLPDDGKECAYSFHLSVVHDRCLLVKYDEETTNGSIWVLESPSGTGFESMCWKRRCSFCTEDPDLNYIDVLKSGDLLVSGSSKVVRYDVVSQKVKMVLNLGDALIGQVYEYNESLMLLK